MFSKKHCDVFQEAFRCFFKEQKRGVRRKNTSLFFELLSQWNIFGKECFQVTESLLSERIY